MSIVDSPEPPPQINVAQPVLSPHFCFNTTALRDFLRLSRSTLDDSISAHVNSLITPAKSGFSPSSTSSRSPQVPTTRQQLPALACARFQRDVLFPNWQIRSNVIAYCKGVAQSSDPGSVSTPAPVPPPISATGERLEEQARHQTGPSDLWDSPPKPSSQKPVSRNYWGKEQVVDERTDPYSGRDYSYTREPRQQILTDVLHIEEGVESIVRARTWSVLVERCVDDGSGVVANGEWKDSFESWRRDRVR